MCEYFLASLGKKLEGPFTTRDAAVEALLLFVCDPWAYDQDQGVYVADFVAGEYVPTIQHSVLDDYLLDDNYVRGGGAAVEGPNVVDWFDPINPDHVDWFNFILKGCPCHPWLEGVLPDYMRVGARIYMAYFPVNWKQQIKDKIESKRIVFDMGRYERDTELSNNNSSSEENMATSLYKDFKVGDFVRVVKSRVLPPNTVGVVKDVSRFSMVVGLEVRGFLGLVFIRPDNLILANSTDDSDWHLIKEDVISARFGSSLKLDPFPGVGGLIVSDVEEDLPTADFEELTVQRQSRRPGRAIIIGAVLTLVVALSFIIQSSINSDSLLVTSVHGNGHELVLTVEKDTTAAQFQAYRRENAVVDDIGFDVEIAGTDVEWFLYPSGVPATENEAAALEKAYQEYLVRKEALDALHEADKDGR